MERIKPGFWTEKILATQLLKTDDNKTLKESSSTLETTLGIVF